MVKCVEDLCVWAATMHAIHDLILLKIVVSVHPSNVLEKAEGGETLSLMFQCTPFV
jgi:hypothetical protein